MYAYGKGLSKDQRLAVKALTLRTTNGGNKALRLFN